MLGTVIPILIKHVTGQNINLLTTATCINVIVKKQKNRNICCYHNEHFTAKDGKELDFVCNLYCVWLDLIPGNNLKPTYSSLFLARSKWSLLR